MRNEPTVRSFRGENEDAEAQAVVAGNLEYIFRAEASVYERKFAHLKERAGIIARMIKAKTGVSDIMDAVAHSYEASEIYADQKGGTQNFEACFAEVNLCEAAPLSENSRKLDILYICKCIAEADGAAYGKKDIVRWLCESEEAVLPASGDKKVSFVRGNGSGRAFERFAKYVPGVLAEYEEDFRSALEAVANGESTYAIVPIENSLDGRLNSFYRLIEKYALSIVLTVDIPSEDYESSTKFALVYKNLDIIEASGETVFECKITFSEQKELGDIILASQFFGAEICKIHSLPLSSGGRENSFDITFGLNGANAAGLFCFLFLEYPYFASVGLYTDMED